MLRLLTKPALREWVWAAALLAATLAMVLAPQKAMEGARSGLALCGNVIIPSLFPFLILSSLVVELGMAARLGRAMGPVMRPLFRVNGSCACALALGFIGGYPVGARTAISLYRNKLCSRTEAQRLLAFCNNSGPAFIFGVVGAGVFGSGRIGVLLYIIHVSASLCVGLIARFFGSGVPDTRHHSTPAFQTVRVSSAFTDSIKTAFFSVLNICAFVVFFAVVLRLLSLCGLMDIAVRLLTLPPSPLSPVTARQLLTGLVELSSGVTALTGGAALPMAAFMLGWAGLCVHCQVLSFLADSGLSALPYLLGKVLHGLFSALFASLLSLSPILSQPVSACLATQAENLTMPEAQAVLAAATVAAWLLWLIFLLFSAHISKKRGGKTISNGV